MLAPLLFAALIAADPAGAEVEEGFTPLFDGATLAGWSGREGLWAVEGGAIVGRSTARDPLPFNTFLVLDAPAENFDLRLKYKIEGGNSGVQYRSQVFDAEGFRVRGPQADIDSSPTYTGIHYSEGARGVVATRGRIVRVTPDGANLFVGTCGDPAVLQERFVTDGWNDYRVVADGPTMRHFVNGQLFSEVTDGRPDRETGGVIALQLHRGPPMTVRFKDVRIRRQSPRPPGRGE